MSGASEIKPGLSDRVNAAIFGVELVRKELESVFTEAGFGFSATVRFDENHFVIRIRENSLSQAHRSQASPEGV